MKRKIKNINVRLISAMILVMVGISCWPFVVNALQTPIVGAKQ
ncbi:hypothetical protein [Cognaticolwellia beringensis]|nr:hypothetical protein [Cognaticolwellia beringensis]